MDARRCVRRSREGESGIALESFRDKYSKFPRKDTRRPSTHAACAEVVRRSLGQARGRRRALFFSCPGGARACLARESRIWRATARSETTARTTRRPSHRGRAKETIAGLEMRGCPQDVRDTGKELSCSSRLEKFPRLSCEKDTRRPSTHAASAEVVRRSLGRARGRRLAHPPRGAAERVRSLRESRGSGWRPKGLR